MSTDRSGSLFATTHWTLIVETARGSDTEAVHALSELVKIYWQPLYRYARRKGKSKEDAEDLVQSFMLHIIEDETLNSANRDKGRFRSFLLTCFNNWMINKWRDANRQKRGGGEAILSFDWECAETGLQLEAPDEKTPAHHFDREWALALLAKVLGDLENASHSEGSFEQFQQLKPYLTVDSDKISYNEISEKLGVSSAALRVAVHRLRKRYRDLLTAEILKTLASPDGLEEELQSLFSALSV